MSTVIKYSPAELEEMIDRYFDECEENNVFPDAAGMRIYIGMSKTNYNRLLNADVNAGVNTESIILLYIDKRMLSIDNIKDIIYIQSVLSRAKERRESWLARKASADGKLSKGCEFLLKQADNGGLTDKAPDNTPKELVVRIDNGGSDPFA